MTQKRFKAVCTETGRTLQIPGYVQVIDEKENIFWFSKSGMEPFAITIRASVKNIADALRYAEDAETNRQSVLGKRA